MKTSRFKTKAALIAGLALALVAVLAIAIWLYPPLLMYGMLAGTAVLAYVAVYFLVLSKLHRRGEESVEQRDVASVELKRDMPSSQ